MVRPLGVTVLGFLVFLAGFVVILAGIGGILLGLTGLLPSSPVPLGLVLEGVIALALGIVLLAAGAGLLQLRPWAWWLAVITVLLSLVYTVYGIWQSGAVPIGSVVSAVLLAVIFVYLLSVYRFFRRPMVAA
jgi:uncharacterized membrane protein (DUF2068 family)